jgi:hypothetical protein
MAILAIHTDCFKLLILAISCKNIGDEYLDTTRAGGGPAETSVRPPYQLQVAPRMQRVPFGSRIRSIRSCRR